MTVVGLPTQPRNSRHKIVNGRYGFTKVFVPYFCLRQLFPAHDEFLIVFITEARFAGRLEVVAVELDRFFEKLVPVEPLGASRIFSQGIRFQNQHIGCGHTKVGHGDPG